MRSRQNMRRIKRNISDFRAKIVYDRSRVRHTAEWFANTSDKRSLPAAIRKVNRVRNQTIEKKCSCIDYSSDYFRAAAYR